MRVLFKGDETLSLSPTFTLKTYRDGRARCDDVREPTNLLWRMTMATRIRVFGLIPDCTRFANPQGTHRALDYSLDDSSKESFISRRKKFGASDTTFILACSSRSRLIRSSSSSL